MLPRPCRDHRRQCGPGGEERPGERGVDDALPVGERHLGDRMFANAPGGADEAGDPVVPGGDPSDCRGHRRVVGDVDHVRFSGSRGGDPVERHDRATVRAQARDDCRPEPAGPAGHHNRCHCIQYAVGTRRGQRPSCG